MSAHNTPTKLSAAGFSLILVLAWQITFHQPSLSSFSDESKRRSPLKSFRLPLILVAACTMLVGGAPMTIPGTSALAARQENVPAAARQELAVARNATAKYHDI